jgi:hypothetical protein
MDPRPAFNAAASGKRVERTRAEDRRPVPRQVAAQGHEGGPAIVWENSDCCAPISTEIALLRSYLAREIDAILYDEE